MSKKELSSYCKTCPYYEDDSFCTHEDKRIEDCDIYAYFELDCKKIKQEPGPSPATK